MICRHCGHRLEWVEEALGKEMVLRVTDGLLIIDRPSCAPWWNHEVFNRTVAARDIVQAMNGTISDNET